MKIPGIPTCKDVFDKRFEADELSFSKKLMRKLHISMCKNCQNFQATMQVIEDKMKTTLNNRASQATKEDIEDLKKRIKKRIKDEIIK